MSDFLKPEMAVCAAIGVVFSLLWTRRVASKAAYLARKKDLDQALIALQSYESAFKQFMELDAPGNLKDSLADFSKIIANEKTAADFAYRLTSSFNDRRNQAITERAQTAINELNTLRETRPGKAQVFDKAVVSGLIGTALRWPSVGKMFQDEPTKLVIDREREVAEVIRVTQPNEGYRVNDHSDLAMA